MRLRICIVVLVVVGAAAFAPAPLPRTSRKPPPPGCSVEALQGTWRVIDNKISRGGGKYERYESKNVHVRISGNKWTFMHGTNEGVSLILSIDHAKQPAVLTFYQWTDQNKTKPHGVGLVRRVEGQLEVLYTWGGEEKRPADFETAPSGFWLRTLVREGGP